MKRVAPAVLLASLLGPAVAAESGGLDLHGVVEMALERNPLLKAIEERHNEMRGGIREAKADAFPQLALRSGWNQSRNPSLLNSPDFEDIIELFPDFEPATQELYNVALDVSQPVYTSGKIGSAIELAKLAAEITDAQIAAARLEAAGVAAEAFFRLLEAQQGLTTIEIQQQTRRESLEVVTVRYELGEATELEKLQAEAALAELQPSVDAARGLVRVAEIDLRTVLNLAAETSLVVEPAAGSLPEPLPVERALAMALARRPEFIDLELQIEAYDRQKAITRAEGYPRVDLTGSYGHTARLAENLDDTRFQDWFVGIAVRWEILDGGRRRGEVEQLDSQQRQLRWELANLRNQIRREVESAHTEYTTALSAWQAAELSAAAAREASRVARESYTEGVAIQADWLNAQEREVESEVALVQAYYGAHIAAGHLARALGLRADESWPLDGNDPGEEE